MKRKYLSTRITSGPKPLYGTGTSQFLGFNRPIVSPAPGFDESTALRSGRLMGTKRPIEKKISNMERLRDAITRRLQEHLKEI